MTRGGIAGRARWAALGLLVLAMLIAAPAASAAPAGALDRLTQRQDAAHRADKRLAAQQKQLLALERRYQLVSGRLNAVRRQQATLRVSLQATVEREKQVELLLSTLLIASYKGETPTAVELLLGGRVAAHSLAVSEVRRRLAMIEQRTVAELATIREGKAAQRAALVEEHHRVERLLHRLATVRTHLQQAVRATRELAQQRWALVHKTVAVQLRTAAARATRLSDRKGHHKPWPGKRVVQAALKQLGRPYLWGGDSPSGFDCSGLTAWAYTKADVGVTLPHLARAQFQLGKPVALSQLRPGDLVFFEKGIGHVAIYLADGLLIEATHTGDIVRITHLDDDWHVAQLQGARRYL